TLDRVEMGQGTMTSSAQMVAEELEIDPARLVIELAGADRAYDNAVDPRMSVQITGGGLRTKNSFDPPRTAAAAPRASAPGAAAERWAVPTSECAAEDGAIVHAKSGRRARYGELAEAAAREEVPDVAPKPPEKWRWIGKPLGRLDARAKVEGAAIYGLDVSLP